MVFKSLWVFWEIFISNNSFLQVLDQYEGLLLETKEPKIIGSICNQVISKYEELVMGDKD